MWPITAHQKTNAHAVLLYCIGVIISVPTTVLGTNVVRLSYVSDALFLDKQNLDYSSLDLDFLSSFKSFLSCVNFILEY
jgi:hypothetical protein